MLGFVTVVSVVINVVLAAVTVASAVPVIAAWLDGSYAARGDLRVEATSLTLDHGAAYLLAPGTSVPSNVSCDADFGDLIAVGLPPSHLLRIVVTNTHASGSAGILYIDELRFEASSVRPPVENGTLITCGIGGGGEELNYGADLDGTGELVVIDETGDPVEGAGAPTISLDPGETYGFTVLLTSRLNGFTGRVVGTVHGGDGTTWIAILSGPDEVELPGIKDPVLVAYPYSEAGQNRYSCYDFETETSLAVDCVMYVTPSASEVAAALDVVWSGEPPANLSFR